MASIAKRADGRSATCDGTPVDQHRAELEVDLRQSAKSPQEFQEQSIPALNNQRASDASSPTYTGPLRTCQR
jgi:hypothetical protein